MAKKDHSPIVQELDKVLDAHKGWSELLEASLKDAYDRAQDKMVPKEWERYSKPYPANTLPAYRDYVDWLVTWAPVQERDYHAYQKAVFFELCKFYWLLDQPDGRTLQREKAPGREEGNDFTDWMVDFANDWGNFLNTPESLTQETLVTFYQDTAYTMDQYVGYDPDWEAKVEAKPPIPIERKTWMSFNQFFSREVKGGLRPVAGMFDDKIICAPADCTFKEKFHIDEHSQVTVKLTHRYNVLQLLEGSPYQDRFENGIFMHSFLGPNDYHRFHAPVRGTVLESRAIQEQVYLDVTISDGQFDAPDGAGYQFSQTRGLIIFDSPVGLVAVLPIGMAQVSSVNMTAVVGSYFNKGDEFGYFQFGGSDIILLFEADSGVTITAAPGIHTNVGMCIAEVVKLYC
jgi:phosphatidylserine decarboxylase precursor